RIVETATVVRVAGSDVAVQRPEADFAVAHAQRRLPARGEAPARFREQVAHRGAVALVAAQAPHHAQVRADEAPEAAPVFAGALQFGAHGERVRAPAQPPVEGPARIQAGVIAA